MHICNILFVLFQLETIYCQSKMPRRKNDGRKANVFVDRPTNNSNKGKLHKT